MGLKQTDKGQSSVIVSRFKFWTIPRHFGLLGSQNEDESNTLIITWG